VAYDLRIYRVGPEPDFALPITEDEWKTAVTAIDGVRIVDHPVLKSEQLPSWANLELYNQRNLDAEIFLPEKRVWRAIIHWRRDDAVFNADALRMRTAFLALFGKGSSVDTQDPVWKVVSRLAEKLGAVIEGDDGERYDLHTGALMPESQFCRM